MNYYKCLMENERVHASNLMSLNKGFFAMFANKNLKCENKTYKRMLRFQC